MFKQIKQEFSINSLLSMCRNDEERRTQNLARHIVDISNSDISPPYNVISTNTKASHLLSRPYGGMNAGEQNPLSTSSTSHVAPSFASTYSGSVSHLPRTNTILSDMSIYADLEESTDLQDSQQNWFFAMDLPGLIDAAASLSTQPKYQEFKMILFNDSLRVCSINFTPNLIYEIRNALLQGTGPSYQFLGDMAISLSGYTKVIKSFKETAIIDMQKFNERHIIEAVQRFGEKNKEFIIKMQECDQINSQLCHCVRDLCLIGDNYYHYMKSGPELNEKLNHLVVRSYNRKEAQALYESCSKLDQKLKLMLKPEHKSAVSKNLKESVNKIIANYFELDNQPHQRQLIRTTDCISPNELGQIQALLKYTGRDGKGHETNAGGLQHVHECYAEMFKFFLSKDEIKRQKKLFSSNIATH